MTDTSLWLVVNSASGSNSEAAQEELRFHCEQKGLCVERVIRFPDDDLPTIESLDQAGIRLVAVFAGDGTTNALVTSLYGWDGAILVLPGGTMNLLFHRLHGCLPMEQVIAEVASGTAEPVRPDIIRCSQGDGLSGLMAGPGTEWNVVREALRDVDIAGIAAGTAQAIGASVSSPPIACTNPALGRDEGYPLIMLTPEDGRIMLDGYYTETLTDYVAHGLALLKRDFRDGPHDRLEPVSEVEMESLSGGPIGLLVDGEPAQAGVKERFRLVRCDVDLLATHFDD